MKRTLTIVVVGLLVAVLAIGAIAPAVSAHGDDTEQTPDGETAEPENATDAHAAAMVEWMTARMGPDGVAAFEQETGTTIEVVAHAMAEQMVANAETWNGSTDASQYGPAWGGGYQAPWGGHGPGTYGPGMYGPGTYGPGTYGPGMHGPGMHHGGHMGPAWGYNPSAGENYWGYAPGDGQNYGPDGRQPGQYGGQGYTPEQAPGTSTGQGFFGGFGPGNWFGSGGGPGGYGGHGMGGGMGGMGGGW